MKDAGNSLPPELSGFFEEARRGAPTPSPALQERVLARVEATVAAPPSGSGGSSLAGTVAKGGLALLLALGGGYAAYKAVGTPAPQPVVSVVAMATDATESEPAQSVVVPNAIESDPDRSAAQAAPQVRPVPVEKSTQRRMQGGRPGERPDPLALEEALLEKARAQLSAKPQRALRLLTQHARRFPQGQLAEDRELLRVRAHIANGDTASARDIARKFLDTHPYSANRRAMEKIWEKY